MALTNYLRRHEITKTVNALDVTGGMKYVMVNMDEILEHGLSHALLKILVDKYMDVRPPEVDGEHN